MGPWARPGGAQDGQGRAGPGPWAHDIIFICICMLTVYVCCIVKHNFKIIRYWVFMFFIWLLHDYLYYVYIICMICLHDVYMICTWLLCKCLCKCMYVYACFYTHLWICYICRIRTNRNNIKHRISIYIYICVYV